MPTLTLEFNSKVAEVEGREVKTQIWDTVGQEQFRSLTIK